MPNLTQKYGENPEKFMKNSLDKVLYHIHLTEIQRKQADERFQEEKARKESKFLSRVSSVLISLWDLAGIIIKSPPGSQVVIDADSGRLYRARFSEEKLGKMKALPQKIAGRTSLEMDADSLPEHVMRRSREYVGMVSNQKSTWNAHGRKAPKPHGNAVVFFFELQLKNTKDFSKIRVDTLTVNGYSVSEISIQGFPTKIGISNSTNKVLYYIVNGKKTEI
jgi:hypothetical protein